MRNIIDVTGEDRWLMHDWFTDKIVNLHLGYPSPLPSSTPHAFSSQHQMGTTQMHKNPPCALLAAARKLRPGDGTPGRGNE
jgi:hypothetical protein